MTYNKERNSVARRRHRNEREDGISKDFKIDIVNMLKDLKENKHNEETNRKYKKDPNRTNRNRKYNIRKEESLNGFNRQLGTIEDE